MSPAPALRRPAAVSASVIWPAHFRRWAGRRELGLRRRSRVAERSRAPLVRYGHGQPHLGVEQAGTRRSPASTPTKGVPRRAAGGRAAERCAARSTPTGTTSSAWSWSVVGVLLGLAVYLASPGRSARASTVGSARSVGVGRYVLPVALARPAAWRSWSTAAASTGCASALGVGLAAVALLGLLHVISGPHEVAASPSDGRPAGGWLGAIVGEPARQLIAGAGAVVVARSPLAARPGVLIATRSSLRRIAASLRPGGRRPARGPALRKAKQGACRTCRR